MKSEGGISGFGALCAAVEARSEPEKVGVATALASVGPGAIFWMWMTAVLGMPISFNEAVLSLLFKEKNADGTYRGGPACCGLVIVVAVAPVAVVWDLVDLMSAFLVYFNVIALLGLAKYVAYVLKKSLRALFDFSITIYNHF